MKKELFAGVLLLVLIGLCAWNLRYLSRMCRGLEQHDLTHQDYLWIEQVLQFLMPQWWTEREDHHALASLLLKTQSLIRATR